jgi:subtilisin family serine protease
VINLSLSTFAETELLSELLDALNCGGDDDDDDGDDDDDTPGGPEDECLSSNPRGIVVVAAAGNSASSTEEYPAAEGETGMIAVAASTRSDVLAPFSNYGGWVHVAAPGENIISTVPGGYGVWSGTSMAAPLVSGQAALVRARYPHQNAEQIVKRILEKADPISGEVPLRIDAAASVKGAWQ